VEGPLLTDEDKHTGFVQHWLALGPLPSPGGRNSWQDPTTPDILQREANYEKDLLTATGGETEVQPWPSNIVLGEDDHSYSWRRVTAAIDGRVNLGQFFRRNTGEPQHVLAYMACYLRCDTEKSVIVSVGSDDGFKLWVDGEFINGRHVSRGCGLDDDLMLVRFHQGINLILCKITQDVGGWSAMLRIMDKGYRPISGITELSCAPDEQVMPARVPPHSTTPPLKSIAYTTPVWSSKNIAPVITRVRLYPAPGFEDKIADARIVGSNSGQTIGFVELTKITQVPTADNWLDVRFSNSTPYRWVKYVGPDGSHALIGKIEFYAGEKKVAGAPFGIPGIRDSRDVDRPFDGKLATWYEANLENGSYIGLDLGTTANIAPTPHLSLSPGRYPVPQTLTLSLPKGKAEMRYTTDGSTPSETGGTRYTAPISLGNGFTPITVVTYADGKYPSGIMSATFAIGNAKPKGYTSFHVGNSLTDTFKEFLQAAAQSAGYNHKAEFHTWMGTPTDAMWNNPGMSWGGNFYNQFKHVAPIDILTTQPFYVLAQSMDYEADYTGKFYALAHEASPNVTLYLYQQWPARNFTGDRWAMLSIDYMRTVAAKHKLLPATTWEEAATNHLAYFEALRDKLLERFPDRPIYIIPTGEALAKLKKAYENGDVPGVAKDSFFEAMSAEKNDKGEGQAGHLTAPGRYFVSLVLFCTFYQESADKVKLPQSMTTLTAEQDAVFKKIAWDTVKAYPNDGVK